MEVAVVADVTAQQIKALREAMGLTQQDFAHEMGVAISSVRDWEQGRRSPRGLYKRAFEEKLREHGIAVQPPLA